jgi:uncharacterized membrane protein YoaK (UPF0700 family)
MFSHSESISYYSRKNIFIWMLLAFQAGTINIGGLMACHTFVSHTTGFASLMGLKWVETHDYKQILGIVSIPLFFLIGSGFSGYFVDLKIQNNERPQYQSVFGWMFFLIFIVFIGSILGWFGKFGEPMQIMRDYGMIGLLCLTCGLQNGVVTSVSRAVVRTTHLTGITTDLGIGIVRVLSPKKFHNKEKREAEVKANQMRGGLIFSFITGSTVGAFIFHEVKYYGFILPLISAGYLYLMAYSAAHAHAKKVV